MPETMKIELELEHEFMTCERYHCRMRRAMCVARQLKADRARKIAARTRYARFPTDAEMRYWMCYDCAQGLAVAKEMGILRRPEVRGRRPEARKPEVRDQRPEVRKQRSGTRSQKSENKRAHGGKYSKGKEFPELARKIREIREETGWTQYQLGAWCGLDQSVISRAELGYPISKETAATIIKAIEGIEHGED